MLMSVNPVGAELEFDPASVHWSMPDLAMDSDGDFVVAWDVVTDGGSGGAYERWHPEFQRVDRFGAPQGAVVRPDDRTLPGPGPGDTGPVDQFFSEPSVAADDAGNFVVGWLATDDHSGNPAMRVRRYAADGRPLGPSFQVTPSGANVLMPSVASAVAMNGRGEFVVAWAEPTGIFARRYDAAGQPTGDSVVIESADAGPYATVQLAIDDSGRFAAVWQVGVDSLTVFVRHFGADGQPAGDRNVVATNVAPNLGPAMPDVVMDAGGDTLVTWTDPTAGFRGRRYSATGQAKGDTIQFAEPPAGTFVAGDAALDSHGDILASWRVVEQPDTHATIYARQFTADGAPAGEAAVVFDGPVSTMFAAPVIAVDDDGGRAVALWTRDAGDGGGGHAVVRRMDIGAVPLPPPPTPDPIPDPIPDPVPTGTGVIFGRLLTRATGSRRKLAAPGVEVFLDANDNGVLDAGDATTLTGADGTFSFAGLAAGKYTVQVSAPVGWAAGGKNGRGGYRKVALHARRHKAARVKPLLLRPANAIA